MPAFTKGEWKIGDTNCILGIPIFAEGSAFRVAILEGYVPKKENEANARLIAAAPDMYNFVRCLYEMSKTLDEEDDDYFIHEVAKEILDRIHGKEDHGHDTDA